MQEYTRNTGSASHTPQWAADSTWVHMGNGVVATIIRVYPDAATDDELIADAHKIAAAPNLLAALEGMQQANGCFDGCRGPADRNHVRTCQDARFAIAKARGSV